MATLIGRTILAALALASVTTIASSFADSPGIWKSVLSEAELAQFVAADAKIIGDTLSKGEPDKKAMAKIRAAAFMVAAYAQGQGDKEAGLRDLALKAAKAVNDGKFDEVKKLAAEMKPGAKSDGAKTGLVALHDQFGLDELMQQFKPEKTGGIGLEGALDTPAQKRGALTPKEFKNALDAALRIAVIAQPTEAYAPVNDEGKKTRASWIKWSKEMGELAVDAAKLAKQPKPDDKSVKAALRKLQDNCKACHQVFRDAS